MVEQLRTTQRRLVQRQSALYVNDSESPFTAPPSPSNTGAYEPGDGPLRDGERPARRHNRPGDAGTASGL